MASIREKKSMQSKMALLKAIGKILKEYSYSMLSINLVSEMSGVDKAFIYRNYKDFEGLLKAYIDKQGFWLTTYKDKANDPIPDHRQYMKDVLIGFFNDLHKNEEFQQFLVWELGERGGFTSKVSVEREILAQPIFEKCKPIFEKYRIDLNVIYAWFIAGVYFLVLHKDVSTFCEYDFTLKQDIDELMKTINWMVDVLFDKLELENQMEQTVIRAYNKGITIDDIAEITNVPTNRVKALVCELNTK